MKLYYYKQSDIYFGEHNVSFLTVPAELEGTLDINYYVTGYLDTVADVQLAFDSFLGTSSWYLAQGLYYNDLSASIVGANTSVQLINEFYPFVKALPETFTSNTDLYSSATIQGRVFAAGGNVSVSSGNTDFNNLTGSPLQGSTSLRTNATLAIVYVPIISEACIGTNGQIAMTTDNYQGTMGFKIEQTNNGKFIGAIMVSMATQVSSSFADVLNGTTPEEVFPDDDPYSGDDSDDDPSSPGGGPGGSDQDNWDDDSDPIPVPDLPSISAVDTGFITLYNPTVSELQSLASYLWSGLFDIETYRKIMANPMDTILGLSIVPVNVPSSGSQTVTVGNISTGISLTKASAQFVEVNCGTISISEIWHSYLTYSPYCRMSIMLPYIGAQELDVDQIIGASGGLGVVYHIDVLSGACVAFITINGNVVSQFAGQCAISIPISASDFTNTITSLCTLVASGIGVVATGGMSAPIQAAAVGGLATAAANTAANVISGKPTFAKSGNISGSNGLMAVQYPYLILEKPKICAPAQQNEYSGYPAYITSNLSVLSGFTQIQDVKLNNIGCTDTERDEILSYLRMGVIL